MQEEKVPYQRQIFVCTNNMQGEKPSCGDRDGEAIFKELRRIAKERGLHPKYRVAQAKCLGQCGRGGNIMVYPEGIWYHGVSVDDVDLIAGKIFPEK